MNRPAIEHSDARQRYYAKLKSQRVPVIDNRPPRSAFDAAMLALVPTRHRASMLSLLGGRVSYDTLRHWRRGLRKPPAWVLDRVRSLLLARAENYRTVADQLASIQPPSSAPNILAWNARRAKERDRANREKALQRER